MFLVLTAAVTQASLQSIIHKFLTAGPSAFNITSLISQAAQLSTQGIHFLRYHWNCVLIWRGIHSIFFLVFEEISCNDLMFVFFLTLVLQYFIFWDEVTLTFILQYCHQICNTYLNQSLSMKYFTSKVNINWYVLSLCETLNIF